MISPFILMCAPNGARKKKSDHAAIPIEPRELADCAESVLEAGAAIMHLHVRDDDGNHSLSVGRYRAAIAAIRERVGDKLVLQITTEACGQYTVAQQMAMVRELKPDAVSLALAEFCPNEAAKPLARKFFEELCIADVMSQYILYSPKEVIRFVRLRDDKTIPGCNPFVLFVLGRYTDDLVGDPELLGEYVTALEGSAEWAVCCFGSNEHAAVLRAASMNGHARVGFENNVFLPTGELASDNTELVQLAAACRGKRPLATAADVRQRFSGLSS